jgi:hypothetical protein
MANDNEGKQCNISGEEVLDVGAPRKRVSFDEYFKNIYPKEREERAKGWLEWKKNHPNASPYHF